ncbi:hypothetical protein ABW20_dc0105270 [Dactylellina cionopaga]|nr:hypothetical protein ABW20_dc0105270 [Dactylellina cionopaga]
MQLLSTLLLLSLIQSTVARSPPRPPPQIECETETETITSMKYKTTITVSSPPKTVSVKQTPITITSTVIIKPPIPPTKTVTTTVKADIDSESFQAFADKYGITCSSKPKPTPVKATCPPSLIITTTASPCPAIRCPAGIKCPQYDPPAEIPWLCSCTDKPKTVSTYTRPCKMCCPPAPTQRYAAVTYCIPPFKGIIKMPVKTPEPEPEVEDDVSEEPEVEEEEELKEEEVD